MAKQKRILDKKSTQLIGEDSPFAYNEAYKSLRTNISFMTYSGDVKSILITSATPDEGKTTISINLAISLTQAGKKVLLIDGDLRNPSVHKYMRLRRTDGGGFSTVLSGQSSLADAIYHIPTFGLDLMITGPIPPNASELLSRDSLRVMLEELKNTYDIIIIDTAPVGVVTDAAIIAHHCDGAILNVRHRFADKEQVVNAARKLQASGVKILGTIMNNYEMSRSTKNDYSYEYNYGGKE